MATNPKTKATKVASDKQSRRNASLLAAYERELHVCKRDGKTDRIKGIESEIAKLKPAKTTAKADK